MIFGMSWRLLLATAEAMTALLYGCASIYGQSATQSRTRSAKTVSIPFVGCSSFGQVSSLEAPKGTSVAIRVRQQDGHALAYYKSADGISVLAPRGWYCQGVSGSGGAVLFLAPSPIVHSSSSWQGLSGTVIEVSDISAENSGQIDVAQIIPLVFPAYRWFVRRVWDLDSWPRFGPYPKDTLRYRSNRVVEYKTPARTDGLGNFESWLGKNNLPIEGAAVLLIGSPHATNDIPHVMLLSIRFPPDLARFAPTIVHHFEQEAGAN